MIAIQQCNTRLIKALGDHSGKYQEAMILAKPVLREMIQILQQDIMRDDSIKAEEARAQTRALAAFEDFLEGLSLPKITDDKPVKRPGLHAPGSIPSTTTKP